MCYSTLANEGEFVMNIDRLRFIEYRCDTYIDDETYDRLDARNFNLYEVLGLKNYASIEEVKKNYNSFAKHINPGLIDDERTFITLNNYKILANTAYKVLTNPKTKALYDKKLEYQLKLSKEILKEQEMAKKKREEEVNKQCEDLASMLRNGGLVKRKKGRRK